MVALCSIALIAKSVPGTELYLLSNYVIGWSLGEGGICTKVVCRNFCKTKYPAVNLSPFLFVCRREKGGGGGGWLYQLCSAEMSVINYFSLKKRGVGGDWYLTFIFMFHVPAAAPPTSIFMYQVPPPPVHSFHYPPPSLQIFPNSRSFYFCIYIYLLPFI